MTTQTTTKIYRTWLERIDSGTFTAAECRQWCQAVARLAAHEPPRGKRTNLETAEAERLWDRLHDQGGVRLTEDHETQGRRWLEKYGTKVLGIPADVLALFDHFSFHGDAHLDGWATSLPIWRVHLTDGRTFDYYNQAWQAGAYGAAAGPAWWWSTGEDDR